MANFESVILAGLELNSGDYMLEQFDVPPARKRPEWVSGGDSSGAILGREALYENRVVTCRVRVKQQTTMDLAIARIGALVDKLQEAEKGGIDCVWTPADSTKSGTLKVLLGEIDSLPVVVQGDDAGWFVRSPVAAFTLTCKPGIRGAEVTGPSATAATPVVTVELTGVTGDLPAEGRLRITDNAIQSKRYFDWGLESRYYPTTSSPPLLIDSDSLVTTGFSGTAGTRTGAYDPDAAGSNVVSATLATQPVAVCGTGALSHVGTFRVKARIYVSSSSAPFNTSVRLAWQDGDGPMRANPYVNPPVVLSTPCEVDLGTIRIEPSYGGVQRWTGRIEAVSTGTGDLLSVDYLRLIPAGEGHGVARAEYAYQPGVLTVRDEFTGMTAGAGLEARVAPLGGTWATSGVTPNFTAADGPSAGDETVSRASVSDAGPRYAVLGATNYTDTEVGVTFQASAGLPEAWLLARYVNSSNFLTGDLRYGNPAWRVFAYVGGDTTVLGEIPLRLAYDEKYRLRLVVFSSGRLVATLLTAGGLIASEIQAHHSSLQAGGALATGKPGIADQNTNSGASTRYYDDFYAATPPAEPIAIYGGSLAEVTSDNARRLSSDSTHWGQAPSYRGSYFTIPPAGTNNRRARVAVKVARNDILTGADSAVTDSITLQSYWTPVFLAVPR